MVLFSIVLVVLLGPLSLCIPSSAKGPASDCARDAAPEMKACLKILAKTSRRIDAISAASHNVYSISPEEACRICASSGVADWSGTPPASLNRFAPAPASSYSPNLDSGGSGVHGVPLSDSSPNLDSGGGAEDGVIRFLHSGAQGAPLSANAMSYPSPSAAAGASARTPGSAAPLVNGRWDSSIPPGTPANADALRDWTPMPIPTPKDCPASPSAALAYPVRLGYIDLSLGQSGTFKIRKPPGMARVSDWYWTIPKDDRAFVAKSGRFVDGGDSIYLSLTTRGLYNKPNVFQILIANRKTGQPLDKAGIVVTTSASGACRVQDAGPEMCRVQPPNHTPLDELYLDPVVSYDPRRSPDPVQIFDDGRGVQNPNCYFWTKPQASTSARDCFYKREYCTLPWAPTGLYWPTDWAQLALTAEGLDRCGRMWSDHFPAR
ncbi:MAG: hypothetical protein KGJ84_14030 [Elusimicrobia bacterium]|nr:hypothetical protein [Elusimicrobiota bacterium]